MPAVPLESSQDRGVCSSGEITRPRLQRSVMPFSQLAMLVSHAWLCKRSRKLLASVTTTPVAAMAARTQEDELQQDGVHASCPGPGQLARTPGASELNPTCSSVVAATCITPDLRFLRPKATAQQEDVRVLGWGYGTASLAPLSILGCISSSIDVSNSGRQVRPNKPPVGTEPDTIPRCMDGCMRVGFSTVVRSQRNP